MLLLAAVNCIGSTKTDGANMIIASTNQIEADTLSYQINSPLAHYIKRPPIPSTSSNSIDHILAAAAGNCVHRRRRRRRRRSMAKPSAAPVTGVPVGSAAWSSGLFDCFDDCGLCTFPFSPPATVPWLDHIMNTDSF